MKRGIISVMLMAAACVVVAIPDCVQGEEFAMAEPTLAPTPVSTRTLSPVTTKRPLSIGTLAPTTPEPIPTMATSPPHEGPDSLHEGFGVSSETPAAPTPADETKAPTKTTTSTKKPKESDSGSSSGSNNKSKSTTSPNTSTYSNSDSGSGSLDPALSYACACKAVRKVSLMGASDYCLSPNAAVGNKCGNIALGEKGECPTAGAQPCQDTGHVLTNNSLCAYDKRDDVYKCVASTEDLLIQKNGGKVPKKRSNKTTMEPSTSDATRESSSLTRAVVGFACLMVGIASIV